MAATGPFEARPLVAVAVSGGADSMALCLLAHAWAAARNGRVLALTVDHGLRGASAAEAALVERWLAKYGIAHETLRWSGAKPSSGLEAKARHVRYRLLSERCRDLGVLHLLVGHHLHDQAETVVMRRERGSGTHGLAAMAAVVETGAVRVIRPLLTEPPLRLKATLMVRGQDWIEDPTNRDPAFTRGRMRLEQPAGAVDGVSAEATAAAAGRCAVQRARDDAAVATFLAQHCSLDPAGFASLDPVALAAAPAPVARAALARIAMTVGGKAYAPRTEAVELLRERLGDGRSGTLGRCFWRLKTAGERRLFRAQRILVCREARNLPAPVALAPDTAWTWDGRFRIRVGRLEPDRLGDLRLATLDEEGWREAARACLPARHGGMPRQAALALPVLRDATGVVAVPAFGWWRSGGSERERLAAAAVAIAFEPRRSLSGTGYFLA